MASLRGNHPKLEEWALRLTKATPAESRSFLFLLLRKDLPLKEIWRSGSEDKGIGGDGKRVLGNCAKRQRSVVILDATKDPQMRGIKSHSFQSALCVPIFDSDKNFVGAFLTISDKPETFTNDDKFSTERTVRDLGPVMAAMRRVSEVQDSKDEESPSNLFPPLVPASLAVAAIFLLLWLVSPADREPAPEKAVPTPTVRREARNSADEFLVALRQKSYEEAWQTLDSSLQARWPLADFSSSFSSWSSRGNHLEVLQNRRITRVEQFEGTARVVLMESFGETEQKDWTWELRGQDGDWRIVAMDGPIQSPGGLDR